MNVLLWVLQGLLALHTAVGAFWKFSNSEQTVPSLTALSHGVWLGLSVLEILASVALVLPAFNKAGSRLVPLAAVFIASEMVLFSVLHVVSGPTEYGSMVYWLIVAALSAFIAYGRYAKPI